MSLFDSPILPDGLVYQPDFLDDQEEQMLARWVDNQPWMTDLARRVQHYGWRYDYRARRVETSQHLGALPPILAGLGKRLVEAGLLQVAPDQVILNEYLPGQGIAPHVDCEPCFGNQIAMLSLLDSYPMVFTHRLRQDRYVQRLERRSLCVIEGPSRYEWTHGIPPRKFDPVPGGGKQPRSRRLSLTFRSVLPS